MESVTCVDMVSNVESDKARQREQDICFGRVATSMLKHSSMTKIETIAELAMCCFCILLYIKKTDESLKQ